MIAFNRRRRVALLVLAAALVTATTGAVAAPPSYTLFESGQVRPLAMSPDGTLLFACNTPDARLEVFSITGGGLAHVGAVPVGLEPVAVAARSNTEVWVVNHLSDSVSIVDVSTPSAPRVTRTLLVGDEPRDIVFAGSSGNRAFITTAHRGQNGGFDPQLTTAGIGRADVWVFDASNLGSTLGGTALTRLTLFGDTPRALTVSPDKSTVYAAVFHSGNKTTTLNEGRIPNGGQAAGGLPAPNTDHTGRAQPEVGLIVRHNGTAWVDELGRNWSSHVMFNLPDNDVFLINANTDPPSAVAGAAGLRKSVGTILFNMATNPVSGKVYVSNLESRNEVRFEGPGIFADTTVRGHIAESRITVIDGTTITPRHLNKHINYDSCCAPNPSTENSNSLAFPLEMVVSSDGATMYVAAHGSRKIGVFSTAEIESNTFVPDDADHIAVTGGGPAGLVLDEARGRLYVLTRFDNSVSIVNTALGVETAHVPLHNPEYESITAGRRFLYDAAHTSSHGDSACASCHIFGDFDSLAWDLGNPDDELLNNPGPFVVGPFNDPDFHPMKGPMTTQSLRGMDNHGPMHWRGDRTGGNDASSAQPNSGAFDEDASFKKFNGAFSGLLGRASDLTSEEMQQFTDFILQVNYPPNPIRALDNTLTAAAQSGSNFFFGATSDTFQNCNGCHVTNAAGNAQFDIERPGFFGSDGRSSFENETQIFKVAHLRNMYQKVGMFGMASVGFFNSGDNGHKGDQIRGFGFLHDGSTDTLFRFHQATVFNQGSFNSGGFSSDTQRRNMEQFMLQFPSNHAPIVGQQITRTSTNGATVDPRMTLLVQRATAGECDLIAKGTVAAEARGWVFSSGSFTSDRASEGTISDASLRALANTAGQEITYTCTPLGSGVRAGIDRDEDGYRDRDELDAGANPANPNSYPGSEPTCGDGIQDAGEQCDNGNANSDTTPNACREDCTLPGCGDDVTDSGEQCDDGGDNSDTVPNACREDCTLPSCGDDVVDSGEQCDNGGDNSDTVPNACRTDCSNAHCGDDVVDNGEACDDGGDNSDTAPNACRTSCALPFCGDDVVDSGEQCDDGVANSNTLGDACRTSCTLPSCGDDVVDSGEECDNGGDNSNTAPNACRSDCDAPSCGDGVTDNGEGCDDGNGIDDDACRNNCSLASCGDGVVQTGEECDDDNESNTDACLNTCLDASCGDGYEQASVEECDNGILNDDQTPNACRENCTDPECGDGVTDSGEACDDDNGATGDGCRPDCTSEVCGDGIRDAGETCDGSQLGGQSCSGLGYSSGTLGCTMGCNYDTSGCITDPYCGDGMINDTGETCDGSNLGGLTCADLGYVGGALSCTGQCGYDEIGCYRAFNTKSIKLSALNAGPGQQKLKLGSDSMIGTGVVFNPFTEETQIVLSEEGEVVWSAVIPAGSANWSLAGNTVKWKSKTDPSGLMTLSVGLAGQPFAVKFKAKYATVEGAAFASPLEVTFRVGDDTFFGTVPCTTHIDGDKMYCRF
ncbi:MAG TPA: hypothetical protein VEC57_19200 [Candidatus Limnocylindrales bacterium]|nr:hypothetical protein [Candidatus Limnocylindrales bacterium]